MIAAAPAEKTDSRTTARRGSRFAALLIALLAGGAYVNTLPAAFTLDDVFIVEQSPLIRSVARIPQIFTTHYWAGTDWIADRSLYRPLTLSTYALNYAAHGPWPPGFHAVNVALHALASVLLLLVLRRMNGAPRAALIAAALFAVHPIHAEAVAGIVGRAEILAVVGTLGMMLACDQARRSGDAGRPAYPWCAAAIAAYATAAFSKEIGVVAPALLLAWEGLCPAQRWLLRRRRAAVATYAGLTVVAAVYIAARAAIVEPPLPHPGWHGVAAASRVLTAVRIVGEYLFLLVWPARLLADYPVAEAPPARSILDAGVLGAIFALGALTLLVVVARRRIPLAAWGVVAFAVALFPVSNIPFAIGVMKAERLLYLPSVGFIVAVAALASAALALPRARTLVAACVALAVVAGFGRTLARNRDWFNNETLARATLSAAPDSPIFNSNLGLLHRERGEYGEARRFLERAAALEPRNGRTLGLLGDVELRAGNVDAAIARLEHARRLEPGFAPNLHKLAEALFAAQRWRDAAEVLEDVRRLSPRDPAVFVNLSGLYLNIGDAAAAARVAEQGTVRFPAVPELHEIAAAAFQQLGRAADAERAAQRAAALRAKSP